MFRIIFPDRFLFPILIILFLLQLAAVLFIAHQKTDFFLHDDGNEYLELAQSFATTGTLESTSERYYEGPRTGGPVPEAFRSPFLPISGGVFIFLFRDRLTSVAVFEVCVYAFLLLTFYHIGLRLGGSVAGWLAMAFFAIHPMFRVFSFRFSSELYFTLFLMLYVLAFLSLTSWKKFAFMGLAGGLASLTRPTAVLLLPAFAIFLLICVLLPKIFPKQGEKIFAKYAVYAGVFLLCLTPDAVRSTWLFHSCNPGYFLGGYNCFVGNNSDNAKAYAASTGKEFLEHQGRGWDRAIAMAKKFPKNLPPPEQQKRFMEMSRQEIQRMGSSAYLSMTIMKAWHFIRPWPLYGAHSKAVFFLVGIFETGLFIIGITGIVLYKKRWDILLLFCMILCVGWTAHSLVHLQMRHRIPFLDSGMILFAAYAVSRLITHFRRKAVSLDSSCEKTVEQA